MITFEAWPKIPRLSRANTSITEKIDGTNGAVIIQPLTDPDDFTEPINPQGAVAYVTYKDQEYMVGAQSRKRLIFPGDDNYGFAGWVAKNASELVELLGTGRHFGEWWGLGIQRGYNMDHKVFSLFNSHRWNNVIAQYPQWLSKALDIHMDVVPVLYVGKFSDQAVQDALNGLRNGGSLSSYMWGKLFNRPEGVVVYHSEFKASMKAFVENDDIPKGLQND